jgi:hypothetical protein
MTQRKVPVNRKLAGFLALGCLAAGVALLFVRGFEDAMTAAFIRVGMLLGAFWCALPTRNRDAAWANVSPMTVLLVMAVLIVFARNLRLMLPLAVVLGIVAYFVRPRNKRRERFPSGRE